MGHVCSHPHTHFTGHVSVKGHTLFFPTALSTRPFLWELVFHYLLQDLAVSLLYKWLLNA